MRTGIIWGENINTMKEKVFSERCLSTRNPTAGNNSRGQRTRCARYGYSLPWEEPGQKAITKSKIIVQGLSVISEEALIPSSKALVRP